MNVKYCTLVWAGGTHRFELATPPAPREEVTSQAAQIRSQVATLRAGASHPAYLHDRVGAVLKRLLSGLMGSDDVSETIRCGLIGGGDLGDGVDAWAAAADLIETHVLGHPLATSLAVAQTIVMAAVIGVSRELADKPLTPTRIMDEAAA